MDDDALPFLFLCCHAEGGAERFDDVVAFGSRVLQKSSSAALTDDLVSWRQRHVVRP